MNIKPFAVSVVVLAAVLVAGPSLATDMKRGEELLTKHCYGCHGEDVYVRENRIVKDLAGLKKRVNFCVQQVGVKWFDEEVDDVVEFLNKEYYKFDK